MIVDSSAVLAMLQQEPEAEDCATAIARASIVRMSAGSFLEAAIVVDGRRDPILTRDLDELIATLKIVIEPVTFEQAQIGREAYRDFGKGSGHPAQLNFGDCFAYGLAKVMREPLLFIGNDFSRTDLVAAI